MRPADFSHWLQCVASPDRNRRRRPFADAVHGQDDGLLEWRWKKGGGRVALLVLREDQLAVKLVADRESLELLLQHRLLEQLVFDPERLRPSEGLKAARCVG